MLTYPRSFDRQLFKLYNPHCPINILMKQFHKIYTINRTIILPVVCYVCETWSQTLRKKRRPRVFVNRVLRRVFGPKRDEVTREWRKLHNELIEIYTLHPILFG